MDGSTAYKTENNNRAVVLPQYCEGLRIPRDSLERRLSEPSHPALGRPRHGDR